MKIIKLPRGAGKTTAAVMESCETGKYILVLNKLQAKTVFETAQSLGLTIPFPITLDECLTSKGSNVKEVIVDEADMILECLLNKKITMLTLTERDD